MLHINVRAPITRSIYFSSYFVLVRIIPEAPRQTRFKTCIIVHPKPISVYVYQSRPYNFTPNTVFVVSMKSAISRARACVKKPLNRHISLREKRKKKGQQSRSESKMLRRILGQMNDQNRSIRNN